MSDDRSEILNTPPRTNNPFLTAPLNKKPVIEISANMRLPLFSPDDGYKYLPENMDSYELSIYKKIKAKFYLSAQRTEKGELITDIFDPYDFSKADIQENFGKGIYRVILTGVVTGQDERVDVWQRNIKINDGMEIDFACPEGVFIENNLMPWDKYFLMKKEEEEPEAEEEDEKSEPLTGFLGNLGRKAKPGIADRLRLNHLDDSGESEFNFRTPGNDEPEEEEEEEEEQSRFNGREDEPKKIYFDRDHRESRDNRDNVRESGREYGRDRYRDRDDRDFRPRNRYDSEYRASEPKGEEEMPSWAKKLVENKVEPKVEERKPFIPPEFVALAGTAITAILANMQDSARRRDEEDRKKWEFQAEERKREYEMRRLDEDRKREEEKRRWEEERKREENKRIDEENKRAEERKREEERRMEERRKYDEMKKDEEIRRMEERKRYDEMKREEDRRAEALKEEIRLERERIQRDKDLFERERLKIAQNQNNPALHPQIVEIMKQIDKIQEEKIGKMQNSGDLKSNLLQTVNQFKEVKDMLVDLGLAQPPETGSGGIEGFLGRVFQNMDPEKAAILTQAVFERVGPMLGFGAQPAAELPSEIDVG